MRREPEDKDERYFEVVDGIRVQRVPPTAYASQLFSRLGFALGNWVGGACLGTVIPNTLFRLPLNRLRCRRPHLAFVPFQAWPRERPLPRGEHPWDVVPAMIVEAVSPAEPIEPWLNRLGEYFDAGVARVLFVYPYERHLVVYDPPTDGRLLTAADELDGGPVLPGFRLPVAALFPGPPAP